MITSKGGHMIGRGICFGLSLCVLAGTAGAEWRDKKQGPVRVHMTKICSDYVGTRKDTSPQGAVDNTAYHFWVAGWFSALNIVLPNTLSVLPSGSSSTEAAMMWLENYCKANPFDTFVAAVFALTDDLHPKRETSMR